MHYHLDLVQLLNLQSSQLLKLAWNKWINKNIKAVPLLVYKITTIWETRKLSFFQLRPESISTDLIQGRRAGVSGLRKFEVEAVLNVMCIRAPDKGSPYRTMSNKKRSKVGSKSG